MKTRISKKWSFDAAHSLPHHNGKCKGLHGHTYCVEVWLENDNGQVNLLDGSYNEGMVVDFYDINQFWKNTLEPQMDHKFLNDTIGPFMGGVTTSENISRWLLEEFRKASFPAVEVEVKETASSSARTRL